MAFTVFGLKSNIFILWTVSMTISVLNKTGAIIKYNNFHEVSKFFVPSSENATLCGVASILDGGTGHEIKYFFIILYFEPTNAQLFHKLSHCYMFRHYRVILRELVINIFPSYTSISNGVVEI